MTIIVVVLKLHLSRDGLVLAGRCGVCDRFADAADGCAVFAREPTPTTAHRRARVLRSLRQLATYA